MNINDVTPGQRISFEVYPSATLGEFVNVELETVMTATSAANEIDIVALHANCYPSAPQGTVPNNARAYNYIKVRHSSGGTSFIGVPFIRPDSIVINTAHKAVLTWNSISAEQLQIINEALSSNGVSPDSIDY